MRLLAPSVRPSTEDLAARRLLRSTRFGRTALHGQTKHVVVDRRGAHVVRPQMLRTTRQGAGSCAKEASGSNDDLHAVMHTHVARSARRARLRQCAACVAWDR